MRIMRVPPWLTVLARIIGDFCARGILAPTQPAYKESRRPRSFAAASFGERRPSLDRARRRSLGDPPSLERTRRRPVAARVPSSRAAAPPGRIDQIRAPSASTQDHSTAATGTRRMACSLRPFRKDRAPAFLHRRHHPTPGGNATLACCAAPSLQDGSGSVCASAPAFQAHQPPISSATMVVRRFNVRAPCPQSPSRPHYRAGCASGNVHLPSRISVRGR